jgi:hypothetical protein
MKEEILKDFSIKISLTDDNSNIVENAVKFIRDTFDIFSVAIRVKEGNDFPYYSTIGFSEEFIKVENSLCCKHRCGKLECICGSILEKNYKIKPWFTKNGSFWTNSISDLISGKENINVFLGIDADLRGECAKTGYESVAIIPISDGIKNIGLLQLNDFRKNKFNQDEIETLEAMAEALGCVLGLLENDREFIRNREKMKRDKLKNLLDSFQQNISSLKEKYQN